MGGWADGRTVDAASPMRDEAFCAWIRSSIEEYNAEKAAAARDRELRARHAPDRTYDDEEPEGERAARCEDAGADVDKAVVVVVVVFAVVVRAKRQMNGQTRRTRSTKFE